MNGNCHMKKIVMKEISISDTSVEEGWVLTGPQSPLRYSKEAREKRPTFIGSNKELFPAKCLWLSPLLSSASVFRGPLGVARHSSFCGPVVISWQYSSLILISLCIFPCLAPFPIPFCPRHWYATQCTFWMGF